MLEAQCKEQTQQAYMLADAGTCTWRWGACQPYIGQRLCNACRVWEARVPDHLRQGMPDSNTASVLQHFAWLQFGSVEICMVLKVFRLCKGQMLVQHGMQHLQQHVTLCFVAGGGCMTQHGHLNLLQVPKSPGT